MLDLGFKFDSEKIPDGSRYPGLKSENLIRTGLACGIHEHKWLLFIYTHIAFPVPFPAALLYQPGGRNFHEAGTGIEVRHFILFPVF